MIIIRSILVLLITLFFVKNIKADSTFVSPSIYYTKGSYSEGRKSESIAFYNMFQLSEKLYLLNHYDNLKIDSIDWNYLQQTFLIGVLADFLPVVVKFNFAHYMGDFKYLPFPFESTDYSNLYSTDLFYYTDGYYFGASYTHLNQIGYKKQTSNQITLRFEKILSDEFFISFKPSYVNLIDGRNLYSAALKIHYMPVNELLFKIGGFGGERAYYFDTDLLTLFNQDDTQKYQLFAQAEYSFIKELKLIFAYQHTEFNSFNIDYYIAGIKANLFF